MTRESSKKIKEDDSKGNKFLKNLNKVFKGQKAYHSTQGYKYAVKYKPPTKACAVSIIDTTTKGKPWILRFDRPHNNVNFKHLNINGKISGYKDPHIPLPPGAITVAETTTKFFHYFNKIALPLAIIIDVVQTGLAALKDYKNKTTRNTAEAVASIGGGWVGGYGGAIGGAALGTAIFPGVGTIVGGIIAGLAGGIGGTLGLSALTRLVADKADYDVIVVECKECNENFKWRKYIDKEAECPKCGRKLKVD